eukprot:6739186-Pyramimonas_sp.AAC.1
MWPAPTKAERWALAHIDCKAWFASRGYDAVPPRFTPKKIVEKETNKAACPEFSQITCKGVAMKHVMFWLHDVCSRPEVPHSRRNTIRRCMFYHICKYESVYSEYDRFLPPGPLAEAQRATEHAL